MTVVFNMAVGGPVLNVAGGAVLSHGGTVMYGTVGNDIVGYVNVGGGAGFELGTDREVFRLIHNNDGSITFDLRDQLDHSNPLNLPLGPGESASIQLNLSPALLLQDFDGDVTALPAGRFHCLGRKRHSGEHGALRPGRRRRGRLNQATGTLPTPDSSTGNGSSIFGSDEVMITNAQLLTLVQPGADEEVQFSLNALLGGNVFTVNNENVESRGSNVRYGYDTATQTIVGFVDNNVVNGTYEAGDRVVFRLTALGGGDFRFDLLDQLDHDIFNVSGTGDARTFYHRPVANDRGDRLRWRRRQSRCGFHPGRGRERRAFARRESGGRAAGRGRHEFRVRRDAGVHELLHRQSWCGRAGRRLELLAADHGWAERPVRYADRFCGRAER